MTNLVDDLSVLTTIKKYNLEELVNKSTMIVSHALAECISNEEEITEVDIGIGVLRILVQDEEMKFKFSPSSKLETTLVETYTSGKSSLTQKVEDELGRRIEKTYKDLF